MPRRMTPKANELVHIALRCNNREYLLRPARHFPAIVAWINALPLFFQISLHHVIVMTNHLHLVLTPQEDNLGHAMSYWMTNLAKYLNYRAKRRNHLFGTRYHASTITQMRYLRAVIRYLYHNPLQAGITSAVEQYPFSSLGTYLGTTNVGLYITPDPYSAALLERGLTGLEIWRDLVLTSLTQVETSEISASLARSTYTYSARQIGLLNRHGSALLG
jgi:putative transposase